METNARHALAGLHVLVVEDEHLIAMMLTEDLEAAGATVIGPAERVERALDLMDIRYPDAAILDIALRSETSYPIADVLLARQTPFIFTSGFDERVLPAQYREVPVIAKPAESARVIEALVAECRLGKRRG